MLYFSNMSSKIETAIMLPFLPEINGDKFYFCVGTTSPNDRVYFIEGWWFVWDVNGDILL